MKNHQHINGDSGSDEYYTPGEIIEAARRTMGGIDLDPASSLTANKRVKAYRFLTQADDGLRLPWTGRVWLNHPFGKSERACKPNCNKNICRTRGHCIDKYIPGNYEWIAKLASEFEQGGVSAACCITFASTSEAWFRPLLERPQCFLTKRTNYFLSDGTLKTGVTKGSVITYFGEDISAFAREFSPMGIVKIPFNEQMYVDAKAWKQRL